MTLVFVYAVDGGVFNAVWDTLHKLASPSTYPCNLCALTYGPVGQRRAWKEAIAALPMPSRFLHKDELLAEGGPADVPLPAVFVHRAATMQVIVGRDEIQACADLDALIALVSDRARRAAG
jgi:hypothetical protein